MTADVVMEMIGSYAFPICMCVAMFWMVNTTMKDLRDTISENTNAIARLIDRMDGGVADD